MIFEEVGPVSSGKETVATRVVNHSDIDDTVNGQYGSDKMPFNTSNVELELIENENDHAHLELIENDNNQNHLLESPSELKSKPDRVLDASICDSTEGEIDKLLTKVEQMISDNDNYWLGGSANFSLTLNDVIQLLESINNQEENNLALENEDYDELNLASGASRKGGCGFISINHIIINLTGTVAYTRPFFDELH